MLWDTLYNAIWEYILLRQCLGAENSNFQPFSVNNLFKFSAQGWDLAYFVGNGTKVKMAPEIKPPSEEDFKTAQ